MAGGTRLQSSPGEIRSLVNRTEGADRAHGTVMGKIRSDISAVLRREGLRPSDVYQTLDMLENKTGVWYRHVTQDQGTIDYYRTLLSLGLVRGKITKFPDMRDGYEIVIAATRCGNTILRTSKSN